MANSIEQLAQDVPFDHLLEDNNSFGGIGGLVFLMGRRDDEPAYWTPYRDLWLKQFYEENDVIKIATNTFVSKTVTIPAHIYPRDRSVKKHIRDAAQLEEALIDQSGLFKGFEVEFSKFVNDFLTTDSGGHMLVMGGGSFLGPIIGQATGLLHLDSTRCWRTGNPKYPIAYTHTNSKVYALHYTRVISLANLPSSKIELNDVGICPISCCLSASKELRDVYTLSAEKMGSRPQRRVFYVKKGATIDQLNSAVNFAETKLDAQGLKLFARTLLLAPKVAGQELELDTLDLTSTHDGFDRMDVTIINMAGVAAAFGLNLIDLAISFGVAGQTRATVEVQDRQGRGKGVGQLLEAFIKQLNRKYLPRHLYAGFDNQDDQQDSEQAQIWNIRSQARDRDMTSGVTNPRIERQRMLRSGELLEEEFEEAELLDGRMPDGTDVIYLFYSEDPFSVADLVDVRNILMPPQGEKLPLDPQTPNKEEGIVKYRRKASAPPPPKKEESDPVPPPDPALLMIEETKNQALDRIDDAIRFCSIALFNVTSSKLSRFLRWQMAALKKLKSMYEEYMPMPAQMGQDSIISDTQLLGGV